MNADTKNLVYLNGRFVPESDACISVFDRGFLYGDGVFETMRSYGGRIFRLSAHVERLLQSADLIRLGLHQSQEQLAHICNALLERNGFSDAIVRISVTRGHSVGGIGTARTAEPSIVAFVRPPMPLPADAYIRGVSAKIVSVRRTPSFALDARIKSMNFLNHILARAEAEQSGAYEAIMLNHAGLVSEASTANVFFGNGDTLFTPSAECDILLGITRGAVLELAADMRIHYEEKTIATPEIAGFQECFLTNSAVELLPVTMVDGRVVGTGSPGPLYTAMHRAYRELVRKGQ